MKYHRHLLQSCVDALNAIFYEDRYADKCIEYYLRNNKKWGSRDRRFFAETVYDCVRWWTKDWAILNKEPQQPDLEFLVVSLWRRNLTKPEFPEYTNVSYEQLAKAEAQITKPYEKQAFPEWLYDLIHRELGDTWHDLAPYFNKTNALVLRANLQKNSVQELVQSLVKLDIPCRPLMGTESGVIVDQRTNVFRTELFKKGLFEVQDGSSQQVAPYLGIEPGQRVVDACAGAGGKTLHIADLMHNKGKIISLDIHDWKLNQLKLRARRNTYSNIEMRTIDGTKTIKRLKNAADRLLLDVPCSGLGVLRRNPDTKWKLSEKSLTEVKVLQQKILQDYSGILKVGGQLLYSTCSVLPSENQQQVQTFLENNSNFRLLKQRTIFPIRKGYDGFFMALLEKN